MPSIQRLLRTSAIQIRRAIDTGRFSWKRDRLEAKYTNRSQHSIEIISPAPLVATAIPQGGCFDFETVKLTIDFLAADIVRIHWWMPDEPRFYHVVVAAEDPPEVEVELKRIETHDRSEGGVSGWELNTAKMRVVIHADGCLDFYNGDGKLMRQEYPPLQRITKGEPAIAPGWQHRAKLQPEERIYGLGERASALNLRGQTAYRMWNTDREGKYKPGDDPLYICIPVYIGLHAAGCYLVFYENSYDAVFEFDEQARADFEGGPLRYYFSVGEMSALVDAYTQLTGRPVLPPHWAFGYQHCRWGYEQESELRAAAQKMIEHDIPIKAMHLDIDCLADFKPFTIAPDRFPNLLEFSQELKEQGIRLITILHSCIKADKDDPLFQAGVAHKFFCANENGEPIIGPLWEGDSAYVDFTNPAARAWWSKQYQKLLDLGFSGFWHDMNEPAIISAWGDPTFPARATYHDFADRGGNHLEAHNLYGLQQAQAGYEWLRALDPDKRPFILSRAGWAGLQKYAWTWTGDLVTGWESLRQTIPTVLNLGLSGIPYSGSDIGGFLGTPSPELYLRWFQVSCFLPFCRTHGSKKNAPRVPWAYGDVALASARDFLKIRTALMPYLYTLAWESSLTGAPLVRPLFWDAEERMDLWEVEDTFLLGDNLLVAPIVQPGQQERQIPLPPGDWYDFWGNEMWAEQPQITVPVTLERLPLLVKAGCILPMEAAGFLTLHCYPDRAGNCTGNVYTDALDGYELGRIDRFDLIHDDGKWQLNWDGTGDYPLPYDLVQFVIYGIDLQEVRANDLQIDFEDNLISIEPFQSLVFTGSLH